MERLDLQHLISSVDGLRTLLGPLPVQTDSYPVFEDYESASYQLRQLAHLKSALDRAVAYAAQYHAALDRQHCAHTAMIKKVLAANIDQAKHNPVNAPSAIIPHAPRDKKPNRSAVVQCEIVSGITISAVVVSSFAQVAQTGDVYYIPACDHFAVRLNGKLFHGNIGVVYTNDRLLERVRDCKFIPCNNDPCDFYHDPCKHAGRKDKRNFVASSWVYCGDSRRINDTRGRRLGSRDSLASDLAQISNEEASKFKDQAFHDLLCALLLI